MSGVERARVWAVIFVLVAIEALTVSARAQLVDARVPQTQPAGDGDGEISLNFPDNVPLKTFVEYAATRLGLNVIYDEKVLDQRLTIRSPTAVPETALRPLLESVLRMKGLALVDAEQPGWKKIVNVSAVAQPTTQAGAPAGRAPGSKAVTQIFRLRHADPQGLDPLIKPLLTTPGGTAVAISEQGLLVVTDFQPAIERIAELVRLVDQPSRDIAVEFVALKHADASQMAAQVSQLISAVGDKQSTGPGDAPQVSVAYDQRTNQVVMIGDRTFVAQAKTMIDSLDVSVAEERSPVRFYKLANTTAAEVLATIQALETGSGATQGSSARAGNRNAPGAGMTDFDRGHRGDRSGDVPAAAASGVAEENSGAINPSVFDQPASESAALRSGDRATDAAQGANAYGLRSLPVSTPAAPVGSQSLHTRTAKIASDPHTNTIIVEASPAVQRNYESLIRQLDKRRPQVLIEATIVTLDTSRDFTVGVEISGTGGDPRGNQYLVFSSFGLSTVDSLGRLSLIPGIGFNGALISSDIADIVIRALEENSRAKVSASPRILVNDNSTGNLVSNQEEPFTSNNFNNTVSTTSFGGYAEAGTEITVTPHISESDYLQLEYSVSLSNFTAQASQAGIPPPRQTTQVQSKVTIPDGSTIIVGGLNRQNYARSVRSIPLLGDIPYLGYLFSQRTVVDDRRTVFIFIRPVILRDDKFVDLKFFSERDLKAAGMPGEFPASEPLAIQ